MNKKEAKKILYETLGNYSDKGSELLFTCPECGHHKRKFSINLDKAVYKCWVCDYRGRNIRRLIRRFGTYVQLQAWDKITGRPDLENFADLFDSSSERPVPQKVDLPPEYISLCSDQLPATCTYSIKSQIGRAHV